MAKRTNRDWILGMALRADSIDAVLLESTDGGYRVRRQLSKPRRLIGADALGDSTDQLLPGLKGSEDSDYTIQIGGEEETGVVFLDSEAVRSSSSPTDELALDDLPTARALAKPFSAQFRQLLQECQDLGAREPRVAICFAPPDVGYALVDAPSDPQSGSKWSLGSARDKRTLEQVKRQVGEDVDGRRLKVAGAVRSDEEGQVLAVAPYARDVVLRTLEIVFEQATKETPRTQVLDAEITLHASMLANSAERSGLGKALLVRVGSEETLTMFAEGGKVAYFDRTRAATVFDTPETVASRVLLQMDQHKVDSVDQVFVLTSNRPQDFIDALERVLPDSLVHPYGRLLEDSGLVRGGEEHSMLTGFGLAAAVALRTAPKFKTAGDGLPVNLLPKRFQSRERAIAAFAWHTWLMLPVLFAVTWFFVNRYVQNEMYIDQRRIEVQANPVAPPIADPLVVQARIDSVQMAYRQYTRSLLVLDSLLMGSDRWSRLLERITESTAQLSGVWVEDCIPSANTVTVRGMALSRIRVSQFARQMDAEIERVASTKIEDETKSVTVYEFTMTIPVPIEIPEISRYLQEQARIEGMDEELQP